MSVCQTVNGFKGTATRLAGRALFLLGALAVILLVTAPHAARGEEVASTGKSPAPATGTAAPPAPASSITKPPPRRTGPQRYVFQDQVVRGDIQKPEVSYIITQKEFSDDRAINLETTFIPNLLGSVEVEPF